MDRDDAAHSPAEWDVPASAALLMGLRVGDFTIEERIGQGAFGAVYRARQVSLAREVVLKVLHFRHGEDDAARTRRFLREAKLASQLDHPYAAHVYAFGVEPDGFPWIAMEMVRGTPLSDLLDLQGPLSLHRFVPLFEKICEVVHTAHQQGIVHRDLKPSNVMVISRAGTLLPKLLDLGIARLVEDLERPFSGSDDSQDDVPVASASQSSTVLTRRGPVMGSPPYMAPEQWVDASQADARTDQYALGILAYEALTGERPFRASSDIGMAMAHASKPVPPLGEGFSPALDAVLQRALAKEPADRYEDVLAFAAALRAASAPGAVPERLPRLDAAVRDTALAKAPQPLADAVAFLEAARSPGQALHAGLQVIRVAARLVGLYAVAAFARIDPGQGEDMRAAHRALRRLREERLGSAEWLALARALVRPFAHRPEAHPIPELVRLLSGSESGDRALALLQALAARDGRDAADQGSAAPDAALAALLPDLAQLLAALSFLCEYPMLAHHGGHAEAWTGVRRSARPAIEVPARMSLVEGEVLLAAPDGELVLSLRPLCQLLAPAPGAPEEVFLFEGPGRYGAMLMAFPVGFERHDGSFWDWYQEAFAGDQEDEGAALRADTADARAPYLGLSAFSPEDADSYVGREREVEACVNRLRVEPLLAVVGPSGAGKSSFVQAGIIPALPEGWRAVTVRPGPAPLAQLEARLAREGVAAGDLRQLLTRDPGALGRALRGMVAGTGDTLLLIVDQFEELLTLCLDAEERGLYVDALVRAIQDGDHAIRLVLTLRDDFLVRAQQLPALRERLAHSLQLLGTPPQDELERIVTEPARRAGYTFDDPALPMEMVTAVAGEPGALALLSFTASKLWELRDPHFHRLRRRSYQTLGGVGGALAQHAEETLARMSDTRQALVREAFRQLVTADGTRAILTRHELRQILGGDRSEADDVIEELVRARLVVASEGETGEDRVEVVHEALLSSWPRLVRWQREDAEGARLRDQLRAAARQWEERQRPAGLLWRGDALLEYRVWRTRYRGALTEAEEAFARASLRDEARGRGRRRLGIAVAFGVLAAGLVLALGLHRRATLERDRAAAFAAQAEQRLHDLYLEQGRRALLDGAPTHAFAYLLEARRGGADDPALRLLLGRATRALDGQELVLSGHHGAVWAAQFSPDGARIATAGADATGHIWDAGSGARLATLTGHEDDVWTLRFSPDGARLVTGSWDRTARVWDARTGALLHVLRHDDMVSWADFSPDGARIATTSLDRSARIWDAATGAMLQTLTGHDAAVLTGAWTPDGAALVTGSTDRHARIWEAETGALRATSPEHDAPVHLVVVSPDGARAVTGSNGRMARILPLQGGEGLALAGHTREISHVAFSPDGTRVLTASEDRTAKLWDTATGALLRTIEGHAGGLTFAGFAPGGQHILTLGRDVAAKLWDARTGALRWTFLGHRDGIWDAHFAAAGDRVVTAGFDGTARVWDARQAGHVLALPGHERALRQAALAPDGSRIATAELGGVVRIWDRQGRAVARLETDARKKPRVAWSPGGDRVVTAGSTRAVVWDLSTGRPVLELGHGGSQVRYAAYARAGDRIATTGVDGTARIWDARTGTLLATLTGHAGKVIFADFDPQGRRVVTAGEDRTARIWDAATGALLQILRGHSQGVTAARFSADGTHVITSAEDTTAALWTAAGARVATFEGHADAILDAALSPDGHILATAGQDGKVNLWEAASGTLLWSLDLHPHQAWSVAFDAAGRSLLIAAGQTASLWDVAYDDRALAELEIFAACRAGYTLDGSRLVRAALDPATCAESDTRSGAQAERGTR